MQEQNRKPGDQKGKRQMVCHPVQCLRDVLLRAHDDKAGATAAGRGEELTSFFPRHVPTEHWSVCWIDETLWAVMPGLGLGWLCTFSLSTADPVIEQAHYLLQSCPFQSDKIFTGWSAQLLTAILRPNSCLSVWECIAVLANTLCKLAHQTAFTECSAQNYKSSYQKTGCWAPDEQSLAKPWCKSLHRMKATSSGQITVENPLSMKY